MHKSFGLIIDYTINPTKLKVNNNKQLFQITEYLTNGLYNREDINSEAVISSLIPFIYSEQRKKMNEQIKELKN